MREITVVKRSDDYMAYADGNTGTWECGKTPEAAIGKLMITLSGQMLRWTKKPYEQSSATLDFGLAGVIFRMFKGDPYAHLRSEQSTAGQEELKS